MMFKACMAFHDHEISAAMFKHLAGLAGMKYADWHSTMYFLINLCGGA